MTNSDNYDIINENGAGNKTGNGAEVFNDYENNTATGMYSHAEGENTTATGRATHAEGVGTSASCTASHAEGENSIAAGHGAHAENQSTAEGDYSHSEGYLSKTTGANSHAEGENTLSEGQNSHAEGKNTEATGLASHAEGSGTKAEVDKNHAEGENTTASGSGAHAEGYNTKAIGESSHAEGRNTRAVGDRSFAGGNSTVAGQPDQTVIGRFNKNGTDTLFEVGNGTSDTKRANAFAVYKNGNISVGGVTLTPSQAQKLVNGIPQGITLNKTELSMVVGETATLKATVLPTGALDKTVTWSSNNTAVATVNSNGKVTANKVGTARITARGKNGLFASAFITINPLLIYQTRNTETKWFGENGDDTSESVRPDLFYNHMSKNDIVKVPKINSFDFVKMVTTPTGDAHYPKTLDDYRTSFLQMALLYFCNEQFEPIAEDMIKHFMCEENSNFHGVVDGYSIYKNKELTQLVEGHEKSKEYVNNIKNTLQDCLKEFSGDIYALRYYPPMRFVVNDRLSLPFVKKVKEDGYNEPSFHSRSDKLAGYTICLDSLHGNKVEVTSYSKVGNSYSGNLKFTYYDHFGLDETDLEGYKNLNDFAITVLTGFHDWFILQHWDDLPADQHPKPFVTTIEFEVPFYGNC